MIEERIKNIIKNVCREFGLPKINFVVERPVDLDRGDYSTNIAMVAAKEAKQNPKELAEKIVRYIVQNKPNEIEKVEVAGPGFINFYLSREFFAQSIQVILDKGKGWGKNTLLKGKKVMVEYTDPNPFKEMHIGHLMGNVIGESVSRIIEFSGAEVKRANYQGDVGLHVAKAIWGKQQNSEMTWGQAYVYGARNYDENKPAIDEINKKIYEGNDRVVNKIHRSGLKDTFNEFEKIYKKLGMEPRISMEDKVYFDFYFLESVSSRIGTEIVNTNIPRIFSESDGAIVFHGEKHDKKLHTRVFINSAGLPTYETKELGLVDLKLKKFKFDISITITGNEQTEYFKVVKKAMELVYPDLAEKIIHISHGMMRLPSGKMSSRTGNVVTAEFLIDEVEKKVKEVMKDRNLENADKISLQVAIGAIKYSVLKQAAGKDIIFDFEKSLSFEGDSGPYLQYAATRAHSILEKAREQNIKEGIHSRPKNVTVIEQLLCRFSEAVKRACKEHEPHYITTYLTELAAAFNSFYANERIVDAKEHKEYKVALTKAFYITMKNGLWLLGIKTPNQM